MSLLFDALRGAQDRDGTAVSPAHSSSRPTPMALEPLAARADPPGIQAGAAPTDESAPPARHPAPRARWLSPAGILGIGATLAMALALRAESLALENIRPAAPIPREAAVPAEGGHAVMTTEAAEAIKGDPPAAVPAASASLDPVATPAASSTSRPKKREPSPSPDQPEPDSAEETPDITVRRTSFQRSSRPLALARQAYRTDDLSLAVTLYRQALDAAPADMDALLGLGMALLQLDRAEEAEGPLRTALRLMPGNAAAIAALSRLPHLDLAQRERWLQEALAEQPDALVVQIALGELLVSQQRWAEARERYTEAGKLAPADPDLAYDLAVSLDRTGRPKAAARLYATALSLADRRTPGFDPALCAGRLQHLTDQESRP